MRLYLAGPMSSIPEHNFPAFRAAADDLRARGHDVQSPAEMDEAEGFDPNSADVESGSVEWAAFLARDVALVADSAIEALAVLPGWEDSRGAVLEVHVARELGKPVLCYPGMEPATHPLSERFHAVLRELARLHDRKRRDYGRDDDPFANVRAAEEWGIPGWVGAMNRATDKIHRLQAFARTGRLANEGVVDSFRDLAVYAVIAEVLYESAG